MLFDFDLELTVVEDCMHACYRSYVRTSTWYLTRGQLARRHQPSDTVITELSRQTTTVEKMIVE